MRATPKHDLFELREVTRLDRAYYVKEARRLRAEEVDRLVRAAGRGLARLGSALAAPLAMRRHTLDHMKKA